VLLILLLAAALGFAIRRSRTKKRRKTGTADD